MIEQPQYLFNSIDHQPLIKRNFQSNFFIWSRQKRQATSFQSIAPIDPHQALIECGSFFATVTDNINAKNVFLMI